MSDRIVSKFHHDVDILEDFSRQETRCCAPLCTADFTDRNPPLRQVGDTPNDVESCNPSTCLDALLDEQSETQNNDALSQFYRNEINTCIIVGWKIDPTLGAETSILAIAATVSRKGVL